MTTSTHATPHPTPHPNLGPPRSLGLWLRAIRAPSLTATLAPCLATVLLGTLLAARAPGVWLLSPVIALLAVLGVLAVQIGVNLMNDIEDDARGIDRPGTLGGSGVLQEGLIPAAKLRRAAWLAFALGALLGLPAVWSEPVLLAVVLAGALGAWGYSSGPGLKYRALGDLAVVLLCGPVLTVGFALAAFAHADLLVVVLGLAFGFAALGILHVNNYQDMANDAHSGAKTIALMLGAAGSRSYLVVVYALALVSWPLGAALAGLPLVAVLLPLFAALPIGALVRRLLTAPDLQAPALALVRVDAAKVHLALGALVSLGLIIAHV